MKVVWIVLGAAAGFGVLLVVGFVGLVIAMKTLDPEGWEKAGEAARQRTAERKAESAKKEAAEKEQAKNAKEAGDKIFRHGFTAGYALAKGGALKPSSDVVDAYARQAALTLGESGGLGFKTAWKQAFWAGWSKGD